MAKLSKVEACIFCDSLPCKCNESPKKAPSPKGLKGGSIKAAIVDEAVAKPIMCGPVPPGEEDLKIVREFGEWLQEHGPAHRAKFARDAPDPVRQATDDEFATMEAIRNLEPLLSDAEKAKWKFVLQPTRSPELDRRLTEWRKRNGFG